MSRRDYSDATHCWRGHDFALSGNLYVDCYGRRMCAVCRRKRDRDRKRKIAMKRHMVKAEAAMEAEAEAEAAAKAAAKDKG